MSFSRAVIFLGCIGIGCAASGPIVSLSPTKTEYATNDYDAISRRWTRSGQLLKELDTKLSIHATLFSPDFLAAYLPYYAALFELSSSQKHALYAEMTRPGHYEFVVVSDTHDYRQNDFDRDDSIWRLFLVNDREQRVSPIEIKQEKPIRETMRQLFPSISPFSKVYRVSFPQTLPDGTPLVRDRSSHLALRVVGALGNVELRWNFR